MRFTRTTQFAWIATVSLALVPGIALAADASTPGSKLDSTLDKAKTTAEDSWLTTKVKAALLADTKASGTEVHVATSHGVVTLTGTVESDSVKRTAEKIASGIDGVQSVRNELRVGATGASDPGAAASGAQPMMVKAAQEALKAQGHDPGPIDGILGPRTAAALKEYQTDRGLPVTGRPDTTTLAQLGVQEGGAPQQP